MAKEKQHSFRAKKDQVRKEFNDFAEKVMHLESLKRELNSLDVSGFESEANVIKAQLKDVNSIPKIKKELNSLEDKIRHRQARKAIRCKGTVQLIRKSQNLAQDQSLMKRKINELREELEGAKNLEGEQYAIKQKIYRLKAELDSTKNLKGEQSVIKQRISKLKAELEEAKNKKPRKELSKKDKVMLKKIPELRKQMIELKKDFIEHNRASQVEIDTGVGMVVDDKLEDFIQEVKAKLSERIRAKEAEMGNELKEDLSEHESMFVKRYQEVVNKFNELYRQRVHEELKKEVKEMFKHKLESRLARERRALIGQLVRENARKLKAEHNQLVENLHSHYASKEKRLEEETSKQIHQIKAEYASKGSELEERAKKMAVRRRVLTVELKKTYRKENELDKVLAREAQKNKRLDLLLKAKNAAEEELHALEKKTEERRERFVELSNEEKEKIAGLKAQKEALVNEFTKKFEELKEKVREDARKRLGEMRKEDREKVEEELAKKERMLRAELDREYNEKMKAELRIREADMEKKKAELERHVMDEARRMFAHS